MKERPILFSGEMVSAILEGRKTMTRRVVKPQPVAKHWLTRASSPAVIEENGHYYASYGEDTSSHDSPYELMKCPYGQPGDRLWVRETLQLLEINDIPQEFAWCYTADGELVPYDNATTNLPWGEPLQKHPSIHMPRWASRILLEVVSVRVERLQDISGYDAWSEGMPCTAWDESDWDDDGYPTPTDNRDERAREEFSELWNSLYTKEPEKQWAANPWVWVIEFKRVKL